MVERALRRVARKCIAPALRWRNVNSFGGTGDADLYVRFGSKPTVVAFSCRPFTTGNDETCTVNAPAAGTWYVMVRGFTAYGGLAVKGTYV